MRPVNLLLLLVELKGALEGGEQVRVALLCILLLVVTVIIRLIELGVYSAESLYETHGGKSLAFEVQACEELLCGLSHYATAVTKCLASTQRFLIVLQSILQLVDSLETLDSGVHVACVSEVL